MGTAKTHIGNLLAKLHARDRAQLVIAAYERGLVTAPPRMRRASCHGGRVSRVLRVVERGQR
jgi:hypothetical protein